MRPIRRLMLKGDEIKKSAPFFNGAIKALPIVIGYFAYGIPFGILDVKIGI